MDSRSLILEIQVSLTRTQSAAEVASLGARYAEKCDNLSHRMMSAVSLLNQQMRSEAIRQCEQEPNVIEEFNILTFQIPNFSTAELRAFMDRCNQAGVPFTMLSLPMAKAIMDAYEIHEETKDQVNRFREQNVYRKSNAERKATLEKLCQAEPKNPVWKRNLDDLKQAWRQ